MCGKTYILPRIDQRNSRISSEAVTCKIVVSTENVAAFPTANYYVLLCTAKQIITTPVIVMDTVFMLQVVHKYFTDKRKISLWPCSATFVEWSHLLFL
jgi:hypothetical protein